jgi:hypothetical protein
MVFVFASINVLHYIYRFGYVDPSLHPWDEADLVMMDYLSDVLLDLVSHYFIEDFCNSLWKLAFHSQPVLASVNAVGLL